MAELSALIKINSKVQLSLIFGEGKSKKKFLGIIFAIILCEVSVGFSVFKTFNMLHSTNNEVLIFNSIINVELIVILFECIIKVINDLYLANGWKDIMIYPVKPSSFLLSKCVSICFLNILIAAFMLVPLIFYGILSRAGIYYYAYMILYQMLISALPIIYIVLISLTILWLVTIIKGSKAEKRVNKLILLVDAAEIILTYMMFKPILKSNTKFGGWLFSMFFSGNGTSLNYRGFIISALLIFLAILGIYLFGGSVYSSIVRSEIFVSGNSKKIEEDTSGYEFNMKGPLASNIIRDIKIIVRTPSLLSNCIGGNSIYSVFLVIGILVFRKTVRTFFIGNMYLDIIFTVMWAILSTAANFTSITSFSREGRELNQFKMYPVNGRVFILSKVCVGLLSNLTNFIAANVFIIVISSDFSDFILLEIIMISYLLLIVLSQIAMDSSSLHLKWVNIKELFELEYILKNFAQLMIITIFIFAYMGATLCIFKIKDGKLLSLLTFSFFMLLAVIGSLLSLKKIKNSINI